MPHTRELQRQGEWMNTASLKEAADQMDQLTRQLHHMQRSIRQTIERSLQELRGQSFGSLPENQRFARLVQTLLESHGLRVRCPECGHPAILRCSRSGSSGSGAFVFDHYIERRRTFHGGGATVPQLRIIAKPSRRGAAAKV